MEIYLAGPMRGYPDGNATAFAYWTVRLREVSRQLTVQRMYALGYSMRAIAAATGVSYTQVHRDIVAMQIPIRPRSTPRKVTPLS
jgi:hypothetical protein